MTQRGTEPRQSEPDLTTVTQQHIDGLGNEIRKLNDRIRVAEKELRRRRALMVAARLKLLYLDISLKLRRLAGSYFGSRFAGAFIIAAAVDAVFLVIVPSVASGVCGIVVGGIGGFLLFFYPANAKAEIVVPDLEGRFACCKSRVPEVAMELNRLRAELFEASQRHVRWSQLLRQRQFRESREFRLRQLLGRDWRSLRSVAFEAFLEEVFAQLGYGVETTKVTGDQGADLIVVKNGCKIAIQVKGYFHSVSNSAVQEAYAAMRYYDCKGCSVITNSRFTASAQELAAKIGCVLIDEDSLPSLVMGRVDLCELCTAMKRDAADSDAGQTG
ncbi:MAG TPA: restriction endonuclease [Thermoguttaceae bacterium]|nr:restriction endonuclease [Thermoguttaceae bacterium]